MRVSLSKDLSDKKWAAFDKVQEASKELAAIKQEESDAEAQIATLEYEKGRTLQPTPRDRSRRRKIARNTKVAYHLLEEIRGRVRAATKRYEKAKWLYAQAAARYEAYLDDTSDS